MPSSSVSFSQDRPVTQVRPDRPAATRNRVAPAVLKLPAARQAAAAGQVQLRQGGAAGHGQCQTEQADRHAAGPHRYPGLAGPVHAPGEPQQQQRNQQRRIAEKEVQQAGQTGAGAATGVVDAVMAAAVAPAGILRVETEQRQEQKPGAGQQQQHHGFAQAGGQAPALGFGGQLLTALARHGRRRWGEVAADFSRRRHCAPCL
jgi:hypothetical protein